MRKRVGFCRGERWREKAGSISCGEGRARKKRGHIREERGRVSKEKEMKERRTKRKKNSIGNG